MVFSSMIQNIAASLLILLHAAPRATCVEEVLKWGIFEVVLDGPAETLNFNPFVDVTLSAVFTCGSDTLLVEGFYDGGSSYVLRFSPPAEGRWAYLTSSTVPALDGKRGEMVARGVVGHGPVQSRGFGLYHADGTPHFSVGTTAYQWASMDFARQSQTLATLAHPGSPFNKIRMTVLPKWYIYNHQNPVDVGTAFAAKVGGVATNDTAWGCVGSECPSAKGSFDLQRYNVSFWRNFEGLVRSLGEAGVIADVILFHPYDNGHWGFDCMGGDDAATYDTALDRAYLRYAVARLAAFSNVWWSMANEWSFCLCKARGVNDTHLQSPSPVWDELFETLAAADPYSRQASIHNGNLLYNHSRPWISHVSLQGLEDRTKELRAQYGKPVIWDEVQYEGDIPPAWGGLSGEEEADRFWWAASLGVYAGHSETILRHDLTNDDEQPLWWSKGGELVGQSPARIAWLRERVDEGEVVGADFGTAVPTEESCGQAGDPVVNVLTAGDGTKAMLRFRRMGRWRVPLPAQANETNSSASTWRVLEVDYWGTKLKPVESPEVSEDGKTVTLDVVQLPSQFLISKLTG